MRARYQPEQESIPLPIQTPTPTPIRPIRPIRRIGNHCLEATPEGARLTGYPLAAPPSRYTSAPYRPLQETFPSGSGDLSLKPIMVFGPPLRGMGNSLVIARGAMVKQ